MSRGDGTKQTSTASKDLQTSTASKDLSIPLQSMPLQCHPTAAPCRRVLHTSRPRCNRCNRCNRRNRCNRCNTKKQRMRRKKRLTYECRRSWRRRCKCSNASCFRALFYRALWSSMLPDAPLACTYSAFSCFLMHFVLFLHAPCLCLCMQLVLFAHGYSKEVVLFQGNNVVTRYTPETIQGGCIVSRSVARHYILHALCLVTACVACTVSCYCMCALPLSLGLLLATKEPACRCEALSTGMRMMNVLSFSLLLAT